MALVKDLVSYKSDFTNEEIKQIEDCFSKIQKFIKDKYITEESFRDVYEYEIHNNMYSHSYLVIDFKNNEVYLSKRSHGTLVDNYFCKNEKDYVGFKYVMCSIVIANWQKIKNDLSKDLDNEMSISQLCASFEI